MDFLLFGILIIILLIILSTGLPVAISLALTGFIAGSILISPDMIDQLPVIAFTQSNSFVLLIAPLFILMSEIISSSPVGTQVFKASQVWLGKVPGALAMGSIFASTGFSAVCGSSPVTAATIGKIAVPEMEKIGYNHKLALGATAAGGTLGILIPPSIALVLYGIITQTSMGDLFIARIMPGGLIGSLLCMTIFILVLKNPSMALSMEDNKTSLIEKIKVLPKVLPMLILALVVIGTIYIGITTPTESAAFGVVGALLIIAIMKQLSFRGLINILSNTVKTTGMFFLIVIGGLFLSFILTRLGIPQGMADAILSIDMP